MPAVVDFGVIWRGHLKALKYRLPIGVDVTVDKAMAESIGEESEESDVENRGAILHTGALDRWLEMMQQRAAL